MLHMWTSLLFILLLAGCGRSEVGKIQELTGSVSYQGAPVVFGVILFLPDKEQGHSGPAGRADIVNGKYDTRQYGQGVRPGPHVIQITGFPERPSPVVDETKEVKEIPPLFEKYTVALDIDQQKYDFDVPASAIEALK